MSLVVDLLVAVVIVTVGDPRAAIVNGSVLSGQVVALVASSNVGATALRQGARAGRQFGRDDGVLSDPVGKSILAVLDDSLAGLVSVVGVASLARGDRGVVDELEEVLSVASNDGDLLAVLTESIKLVGVGGLDLLAGDVGELGFGDQRLGFGTDELLLEDDDLGRVGLLVLELGDLVGDLLLAWLGSAMAWASNLYSMTYGRGWAGPRPRCCGWT